MKGVLIVAHGSRQKSTEQTLEAIVQAVRLKLPESPVKIAYMEFGEPNIHSGLNALAALGVKEICVVPYFLFDGIHIREDIPKALDEFKAEHPELKIAMGKTLGADERLASILYDRVMECL